MNTNRKGGMLGRIIMGGVFALYTLVILFLWGSQYPYLSDGSYATTAIFVFCFIFAVNMLYSPTITLRSRIIDACLNMLILGGIAAIVLITTATLKSLLVSNTVLIAVELLVGFAFGAYAGKEANL